LKKQQLKILRTVTSRFRAVFDGGFDRMIGKKFLTKLSQDATIHHSYFKAKKMPFQELPTLETAER